MLGANALEILFNIVIFELSTYKYGKTVSSEEHQNTLSSLGIIPIRNNLKIQS